LATQNYLKFNRCKKQLNIEVNILPGSLQKKDVILGQNYFEVDKGRKGLMDIPVHSPKDSETRICYDGQMGNWETLAQQFGVKNEPFIEERILLTLFKKYGKNQVIIYDEGRAGLDSARAMQAINKIMQDFFQACGQYGHVILIVLPKLL